MIKSLVKKNRSKLMHRLCDGLIFVASQNEILRNGDVHFHFRQSSSFLYLTGIAEPGYALLLDPSKKKSWLFVPDLSEHHQIWQGPQHTTKSAKNYFGTDEAAYMSQLPKVLKKLHSARKEIFTHSEAKHYLQQCGIKKCNTKKLELILNQLRLFKEPEEIQLMKHANEISHQAHVSAMQEIKPGDFEYQTQATLESNFIKHGAFHWAYYPIVAAGKNAAYLHYHANNSQCKAGDLVLIDAGCEWQGYAADVTRTFPVSGKFTKKQAEIYNIVLKAQEECIKLVKPGVKLMEIHQHSAYVILEGLVELGLIKKFPVAELYNNNVHRLFYPHGVGHLLGLDVHDVGAKPLRRKQNGKSLRSPITLAENMVITIEPGLYFIAAYFDSKSYRKKNEKYINWKTADEYRDVGGVRIEDDILVTKSGHTNLTSTPKTIELIQNIMNSKNRKKCQG